MTANLSERRSKPRFQLTIPVLIRWADESNQVQVGYCRNISLSGMLLFTNISRPLGAAAEIELILKEHAARRKTRILCHGTVARLHDQDLESPLEAFAIAGRVEESSALENWEAAIATGRF